MPHYNLPHNHGQNIERVLDNMPSAEGFTSCGNCERDT